MRGWPNQRYRKSSLILCLYQSCKKFVYGAASLASNFTAGGKVDQDYLKQLKTEVKQSRTKWGELEREFDAANVSRLVGLARPISVDERRHAARSEFFLRGQHFWANLRDCIVLKPIIFISLMQLAEASYWFVVTMKTLHRIALGHTCICCLKHMLKITIHHGNSQMARTFLIITTIIA